MELGVRSDAATAEALPCDATGDASILEHHSLRCRSRLVIICAPQAKTLKASISLFSTFRQSGIRSDLPTYKHPALISKLKELVRAN
jgi:hypothetical protein